MAHENLNEAETPELNKGDVSVSYNDDDYLYELYYEEQSKLSESERKKQLEDMDKCADYIMKNKITPNMDSIY